jgi:hypothetical protein
MIQLQLPHPILSIGLWNHTGATELARWGANDLLSPSAAGASQPSRWQDGRWNRGTMGKRSQQLGQELAVCGV